MAVPVHCGPTRVRLGTVRRCYTRQPSSASQGLEGARWGQLHGRDAARRDRHSVVAPAFQTTTSNPALRFANFDAGVERRGGGSMGIEREMTVDGAVAKTGMLVTLAAAAASYVWWQAFTQGAFRSVLGMLPGVSIAALAVSFITCFRPQISPYTAPVFAVMKGAVLGGISVYGEMFYPGIMIQTVALTFGTLGALLAGYVSGFIRVTRSFSETVVLATGGFAVGMLLLWALSHFRIVSPMLLSSGPMALGIGLFSCLLAAGNLLLDFSHIERCAWQSMPRWMEWYSAFSLLITLVWMYQSILRVLMLTRSSNER